MKKNAFQGFADSKIENLTAVRGGYYYEATVSAGGSADEDLITEPGDDPENCGTTYACIDETYECLPGTVTPVPGTPVPPRVPPIRR